ncbi:LysR family transcriptional regulator [Paenibacillus radicis (ex Gao et al. 2016)]|uniref:HTH-type transcriptional regulator YtlI n=1 Tax=Paenibacillus radicis (ex Gao et al. 2016) TaxID=1737354 RepID=A0A917HAV8_9BACL|nr:LysR family transcriptional regulator [Paenibacillus radicis (ex Gao et al. 2016)]GGG72955.1 HTH-type transcriptional regulator YtlI [Paenibacillus radicis (ex Gao et al. 2016)]
MELLHLKTFQAIVKHGNFIRAAEELNYAQSTVTTQMQRLEADLGVQLMERGKQFRLTEAGRLFYEQSAAIIKNMEQLQLNMSGFQEGETGHIRLGVTEPTASYRLPVLLEAFMTRFPGIEISLVFGNTPMLSEQLSKGEIDLAICSAPDEMSELHFEPLFRESFVVLLPENHPLAAKDMLEPADLYGPRLLLTSVTCPYRRKLEIVLQQNEQNLRLRTMEIGSMTALPYYVASGLGLALVPSILLDPLPKHTVMRAISGSLVDMVVGILSKPADFQTKQSAVKLYRYLREELDDMTKRT